MDKKKRKKQPKNKVKHIESESTTRFKNRSSDRMMTSDGLVDVSDDRCTTNRDYSNLFRWVLNSPFSVGTLQSFLILDSYNGGTNQNFQKYLLKSSNYIAASIPLRDIIDLYCFTIHLAKSYPSCDCFSQLNISTIERSVKQGFQYFSSLPILQKTMLCR